MIVATAGHIDHGKSSLIKALSGIDTDRLPEEKARGISIDLGFAYLTLPDTPTIGLVDVPGHERFVRNMLAGVNAIDFVLLVVAADDGVMPQTREHLNIVNLLGVRSGLVALTKIDRVSAQRVHEVEQQIRQLLAPTRFCELRIIPCSSFSQAGIEDIKRTLARSARAREISTQTDQQFRYTIDRAFSIQGSGTVVTGTILSAHVNSGDRLIVSPGGHAVRVRGIEQDGAAVSTAHSGERCALNLAGVSVEQCERGAWLLAEPLHAPTQRLDARLTLLETEQHGLKHWTPVHVHIGTADILANVSIPYGHTINGGASAYVQLVLTKPVAALQGDRFIVREQGAQRTLGGGLILDRLAPTRVRDKERRTQELNALALQSRPEVVSALLAATADRGLDLELLRLNLNLTEPALQQILSAFDVVILSKDPRIAMLRSGYQALHERVLAVLEAQPHVNPTGSGLSVQQLLRSCAPLMSQKVFFQALRSALFLKDLALSGSLVILKKNLSTTQAADEVLWQKVEPTLKRLGAKTLTVEGLAIELNLKKLVLNEFLHRQVKLGRVYRVNSDRFYLRTLMIHFATLATQLAQQHPEHTFIAAQFRDQAGINRTQAIEILDVLDRLGVTQRVGDKRRLLKPLERVFER